MKASSAARAFAASTSAGLCCGLGPLLALVFCSNPECGSTGADFMKGANRKFHQLFARADNTQLPMPKSQQLVSCVACLLFCRCLTVLSAAAAMGSSFAALVARLQRALMRGSVAVCTTLRREEVAAMLKLPVFAQCLGRMISVAACTPLLLHGWSLARRGRGEHFAPGVPLLTLLVGWCPRRNAPVALAVAYGTQDEFDETHTCVISYCDRPDPPARRHTRVAASHDAGVGPLFGILAMRAQLAMRSVGFEAPDWADFFPPALPAPPCHNYRFSTAALLSTPGSLDKMATTSLRVCSRPRQLELLCPQCVRALNFNPVHQDVPRNGSDRRLAAKRALGDNGKCGNKR